MQHRPAGCAIDRETAMTLCIRPLMLALCAAVGHVAVAQGTGEPLRLPPPELKGGMSVEQALQQRRSVREFAAAPLVLGEVSQVLWAAQGVTDPRGWRTAPSAGALAPLELYLVAGRVAGLPAGVYRYRPEAHALVAIRAGEFGPPLAAAALGQAAVREAPAVLVIAAVYQRTRDRYGSKAERFVHIEAGHVAQNVYLQCTARGLATVLVGAFDEPKLREVLGLPVDHAPLGLMPFGHRR
jgi:SagB-type dehydrogenase family enzyme